MGDLRRRLETSEEGSDLQSLVRQFLIRATNRRAGSGDGDDDDDDDDDDDGVGLIFVPPVFGSPFLRLPRRGSTSHV